MFVEVLVASEIVGKVSEADIGMSADKESSVNVAVLVPGVPTVEVLASRLFTTGAEVITGARVLSSVETDSELLDGLGAKKEPAVFPEGLLVTFPRLGLNRTGHMSFLTGQDRTPKFAGPD